jgi:hypothetical protein
MSAARGVALPAAGVRAGLQDSARLASDGGDAAERPRARYLDVVPALPQPVDRLGAGAVLDRDVPREALPWVEARGERLGVVVRRVDCGLEVEAVVGVGEEDVQRPLVLLVAARRAEGEAGLLAAGGERR